ncbi:fluoride efflux transporter CrcB [Sulfurimonas denitrificans]|uniref:Fluoride-specific ion channel FluC n=1 Tax=Sulfurimonas denitrificans (strain ATCC 33889 / DSM 1251) TaxID=326298 RepID=FLUC_SULDN|nr:fluoride efflux transporter CrcB [Sulfurimonas denitrificans]Q30TB5.2 RecName: Full=Fluoride-specific ion channel FluC [Sulfurimonas denitrificans DSM 1251]MDD3442437.1 fluoride efflux transporter CrcB [Sulfurimonas denitrificans]
MSWQTILAIGSGGFIGAVLRAYFNGIISHKMPHDIPFGTLGVNLVGSFIMGILIAYFMYSTIFSLHVKSFLSTGVLGALTTYSTFAIESFLLLNSGHIALALANISLNAFGSILMAGGGFYIIKLSLRA